MNKSFIKQVGTISEIDDLLTIKRVGREDLRKINFIFTSVDNQVHYPEIRDDKLILMDYVSEGDMVEIEFAMQGSQKNGKKYNNILINSIRKV